MEKGSFIHPAPGDLTLWRVDKTFGADSPYVYAVLVTTYKTYYKAGATKRMVAKKDARVVTDPEGFARASRFSVDLNVAESPDCRWG